MVSPFRLDFDINGTSESLQDQGFLIYEPSNSDITISATLDPAWTDSTTKEQITKLTVSIIVSQPTVGETPNTEYRTYTFWMIKANYRFKSFNRWGKYSCKSKPADYDDQYADFKNFNILDLSSGILQSRH